MTFKWPNGTLEVNCSPFGISTFLVLFSGKAPRALTPSPDLLFGFLARSVPSNSENPPFKESRGKKETRGK